MLLSSHSKRLDDAVVRSLARRPAQSVRDIVTSSECRSSKPTLQGVYRVLKELEKGGIVIKVGQRFTLSSVWVSDLNSFADEAFRRQLGSLERSHNMSILAGLGSTNTWTFTDLPKCNQFWMTLRTRLMFEYPQMPILSWHPLPVFLFVDPQHQLRFLDISKRAGVTIYRIEGTPALVDVDVATSKVRECVTRKLGGAPFPGDKNVHVNILGDVVMKAKLDSNTRKEIQKIFEMNKNSLILSSATFRRMVFLKSRVRLTAEVNPELAKSYKIAFSKIFSGIQVSHA